MKKTTAPKPPIPTEIESLVREADKLHKWGVTGKDGKHYGSGEILKSSRASAVVIPLSDGSKAQVEAARGISLDDCAKEADAIVQGTRTALEQRAGENLRAVAGLRIEKRNLERTLLAVKEGQDCIILNGHFWTVQLGAWMVPAIRGCPGMRCLKLMFDSPDEEYSFSDLAKRFITKRQGTAKAEAVLTEDENPRKEYEGRDTLGADDWGRWKKDRDDILRDIECAQKRNDHEGVKEAKVRLNALDEYVKSHYGTRKRPKSYHYAGNDMRQAVSKALNRALRKINRASKPLGTYMKDHFKSIKGRWAYRL